MFKKNLNIAMYFGIKKLQFTTVADFISINLPFLLSVSMKIIILFVQLKND